MIARLLLLAAALSAIAVPANAAQQARLRTEAIVSSDYVRLGDLIEDAGPFANEAVFRSPDLGTTGTVQVARVLAAAREKGLVALDASGVVEVTVTRASRTISLEEMKKVLVLAIIRQNGLDESADLEVDFDSGQRPVHIEPSLAGPLQVTQLSWNPANGRFNASFGVEGSTVLMRSPLRASGNGVETVAVPVFARTLNRGDILRLADVTIDRQARTTANANAVATPELAIGQAVKRTVRQGQPITAADLTKPDLVSRNDAVSLIYAVPGMMLSVRAKAINGGAEGDIVSVINPQSNRVVQATVTGPGRVTILTGDRVALN